LTLSYKAHPANKLNVGYNKVVRRGNSSIYVNKKIKPELI